jgi:DNA-binding MarR family transcriptional regulator
MLQLDNVHLPLEIATQEIGRLCRELEGLVARQARTDEQPVFSFSYQPTQAQLIALTKSLLAERRLRSKYFAKLEFGEPVWDLLLDLYMSNLTGRSVSVSSACVAAYVPPTTALRYITMLVSQGIMLRVADKNDARRVFLALSDETRLAIERYLTEVHQRRGVSLEADGEQSQHGR